MSTTALISVEEYLRFTGKPNAEYRDGVVYPKAMPTWMHGALEFALCFLLKQQGLYAAPEVTVRISEQKYLVPDVAADREIQQPYPTKPVFLCCEILSPSDGIGTMLAKCEEYHAWGVPHCWVIDPMKRVAWEFASSGEPKRVAAPELLRAGEITVSLDELFATLD